MQETSTAKQGQQQRFTLLNAGTWSKEQTATTYLCIDVVEAFDNFHAYTVADFLLISATFHDAADLSAGQMLDTAIIQPAPTLSIANPC